MIPNDNAGWDRWKERFPDKFASEEQIFRKVHPGARIFIGTACGEPQALVRSLVAYARDHPRALFDTELIQVWNLGVTPYADERFQENFRLNTFFIGESTRDAVNRASADYTPVFLSAVPDLIYREMIPIDLALVQTSLPDAEGNVSLGVSVDIVKAAVQKASIVVAQANAKMPFIFGDGVMNIRDLDFIVPKDEPLLEYEEQIPGEVAQRIGTHIARLVEDGATLQIGYGSVPDAVLSQLKGKKHLGLHSELFGPAAAELMKLGALDNSQKSVDPDVAVASFCMGHRETYEYLHRNPKVLFKTIDYTNSLLVIARQRKMTAINSALEVDLTGQATAESIGGRFYSGIGGQADFMRGAVLAPGGKTILALPSTSWDGKSSRIVPQLSQGAGVTLNRGDIRYVVTEYGIAYLHGKNIRERAMDLIAIAHPDFRPWLVEEARRLALVYKDQSIVSGEYPEALETSRITKTGLQLTLRPVRISDEQRLKEFFYSLSDASLYQRFASARKDMPHARLQEFVAVDFTREIVILAVVGREEKEIVVGLGQYAVDESTNTAEVALVVKDDYQNQGVGYVLQSYLTHLAKKRGLLGFTAEVLEENKPIVHLLEKMGFSVKRKEGNACEMVLLFDEK